MEFIKLWGPWVLLTLAIYIAVALIRSLLPKVWNAAALIWVRNIIVKHYPDAQGAIVSLWHAVQIWPSLAAGTLVGAYQLGTNPGDAWKGAAFGLLAPLLHHLLKIFKRPPLLPLLGFCACALCWALPITLISCASVPLSDIRDARRVIAEILCARENAARLGLSIEDVRRGYCAADAVIGPFLERVDKAPEESVGLATQPPAVGTCPKE